MNCKGLQLLSRRALPLAIGFLLSVVVGLAQSPAGNFMGTVTDPSGSVIPGAKVTLTDDATGFKRTAETDAAGIYRFPIVNPGVYTLNAEAKGFTQYVNSHLNLNARQTLEINIVLKVGSTTTTVTVTGQAPLVNTTSGTIGETQSSRILTAGPQGTPILAATSNVVGKTSIIVRDGGIGAEDLKVAGSRAGQWETTMDGNAAVMNGTVNLAIPYQAMQEQSVVAVGAPAEYRTPLTVNAITKSGTNDIHGSYTFQIGWPSLNAMPANAPGAKRGPDVPSHTWNLTAGGPAYLPKVYNGRDRTFWFFSLERTPPTSVTNPQGEVISVPTANMRNGIFQPYFNAAGVPTKQLKNPFTGQPFTGNTIPSSMFNPAAVKALANYLPPPNSSVANPDLPSQNYVGPSSSSNSNSVFLLRLDQNISHKNKAYFSYDRSPLTTLSSNNLPTLGNNVLIGRTREYSAGDTQIISSRIVNEVRFATMQDDNSRYSNAGSNVGEVAGVLGMNLGSDAAYRAPYHQAPFISINGFTYSEGATIGGVYAQDVRQQHWMQIRDNLSIQAGRHAFKMGYDQQLKRDARPPASNAIGSNQTFTGTLTGDPFADFLLGLPQTVTRYTSNFPLIDLRSNQMAFYFQDDFRVNSRLNLSYGLRYEHRPAPREIHGANISFDPRNGAIIFQDQAAINMVPAGFPSTFRKETAAAAGYPHYLINANNDWTPRLGFAYKLSRSHDVVVRGAYDIFAVDAGTINNAFRVQYTTPFAVTDTFTNAITNGTPLMTLDNPFPANVTGKVSSTLSTGGTVPNLALPIMQQYTLSLESRLFAGWTGTLSYIGSTTTQLWWNHPINRPHANPTTPYSPVYPGFSTISYFENGSTAAYNGLQARMQHKFSSGLDFDAMFQWQSEATDVADTGFSTTGSAPDNPDCRRCYWRKNPYTDSLDFRAISLYELPVGRGKPFASNINRYANGAIGGWTVSSILDIQNGRPGAVYFSGADVSHTNLTSGFAQLVPGCNPRLGDGFTAKYLNVNCFTIPAAGTFGDAGWGVFQNPGLWVVSGTLYKYFPLYKERAKLRINAIFTNAFNHPSFTSVGNSIAAPASFGRFGGQGGVSSFAGARTVTFQGQVLW